MSAPEKKPEDAAGGAGGAIDLFSFAVSREVTERMRVLAPEILADFDHDSVGLDRLEGNAPERRGPGRPAGSPNKTNADFRKYIIERFGHPLVGTAIFGSWRSAEELVAKVRFLAKTLGIGNEKALDFMQACNTKIAPFVEGQMPIRLEAKLAGGITIAVGAGTFDTAHLPGEGDPA